MKIRNTAVQAWKDCRRAFLFRWVQGWELKGLPNENLLLGQTVHAGLAAHHSGQDPVSAIRDFCQGLAGQPGSLTSAEIERLETCHGKAQAMVAGYARQYPTEPPFLAVEQSFEVPLGNGHHLTGTIDGYTEVDGDLWLVEHKTSSDFSQPYFDAASISWQVYGYMLGARSLTKRWPKGIIYNVLLKSALRQKVKETKEEFHARIAAQYTDPETGPAMFRRVRIILPKRQLEGYLDGLKIVTDLIAGSVLRWETYSNKEDARNMLFWPNTGFCIRGHTTCQFLGTCSAYQDQPDAHFFQVQEKDQIHV